MKDFIKTALTAAALAWATAQGAGAATIDVWNDTDLEPYPVEHRGDVTCSSCEVLVYSGTDFGFSAILGELFDGPANSGDLAEATWVNDVLGTDFTKDDVTAGKEDGDDAFTYLTDALYVVLKIGRDPDYTIIKNTSGGEFSWSWTPLPGMGAGLSHYIELGQASPVPVPAAGLLLAGGLGGLGMMRRRRSSVPA